MLINTFLDTEDFVHLYYPEDEPAAAQGCGAGARMASKYPPRPPSPEYTQSGTATLPGEMSDRERRSAPPPPEPPPHRVRASDLYPRLRTHFDEPALEVPFTPICAEFVQWVGKTADGGTVAMSNYRLHAQPRQQNAQGSSVPIRLIDALEIRDLLHLVVLCKNGRQLKFTFNTGDQCLEWWRRLSTALSPMGSIQETFAAAYAAWAKEQAHTSVHRALLRASHAPQRHWFGPEVERLGFTANGAWRVTAANAEYTLCSSYPPLLVVPAAICDEDLDSVARFRAMRRIPAVVWRHRGNGAVIARSSQPEVGWLGWRSSEDERLLAAFVTACNADRGLQPTNTNKQVKLLIVDARSYASAVTNRARGGGSECQQYYPAAEIQYMYLPNIHHVRRSFQQMRALAAEPGDQNNWHSNLERTLWLQYVSGVCRAASVVARAVLAARPVLVHCSDGWDRTPQIVAAAQIIMDPYYRTMEGFRVLIEREWLDFGHKFADRCGHQFGPEDPNERSPIFLQWLDVVHQIMLQHPCSFEFNNAYLIKLATHVHSCMFGTFLCNTTRERLENRTAECTAQVWHLLKAPAYRNHLFSPHHLEQMVWPECSPRNMQVWAGVFGTEREQQEQPPPRRQHPPTANGLMTKTRSCDNLLNEGERRMTQRRCSDPSIAPDVMTLSLVNDCRATLTDSCVDSLPFSRAHAQDQVEGLHPEHFENGGRLSRDIASGSSSLERELADVPPTGDRVIDHGADVVIEHTPRLVPTEAQPAGDTPEEQSVFLCGAYTVVDGIADAAKEVGRIRNDSITWRSSSESSNQSSSGVLTPQGRADAAERDDAATASADSTDGRTLHNSIVDVSAQFQDVNLNGGGRVARTWSSGSSESECEGGEARAGAGGGGAAARGRVPSQLTLCPASPRRLPCCHCANTHGAERAPVAACWCGAGPRCVCGAHGDAHGDTAPPDGLPPALDPLQARLHEIILYQKKVVEELSGQLREAREALRLSSPPPPRASPLPAARAPSPSQKGGSGGSGSSSSGSLSEVEVGEEARGVVWLPDSAAPRCQHCRNHFWLARRRHHCRRCGGIFCGSCSEMSAWGECGAVRVCRRCRALR